MKKLTSAKRSDNNNDIFKQIEEGCAETRDELYKSIDELIKLTQAYNKQSSCTKLTAKV